MSKPKYYIAYGSNLNVPQMIKRCPSASIIARCKLRNWRLRFMGIQGCAVATIQRALGYSVPTLLWKIDSEDELALDHYEGYPHLYRKEKLTVTIHGTKYSAMVYILNERQKYYDRPCLTYLNTIAEGYETARFKKSPLFEAAYGFERSVYHMMTKKIKEQILAIRDTGEVNMFDVNGVQRIADREGYYELVCYLSDSRNEYGNFIITGEAPGLKE